MTFQEIITMARIMADAGTNAFANSEALLSLNAGLEDWANDGGQPNNTYTQDVLAGTNKYNPNSIPDSWTEIQAVWHNQIPLESTSEDELNALSWNWQAQTGTPVNYFLTDGGTKIQLYPNPSDNLTGGLVTRFTVKPTYATQATLANSPALASQYHESLAWKIAGAACSKFGETQKMAYWDQKFQAKIREGKVKVQFMDKGRSHHRRPITAVRHGYLRVNNQDVRIY